MTIYDILGRKVAVLFQEQKNAGTHAVQWSGINRFGQSVASGTYFAVLEARDFNQVQKVLLIK
jgi:flagellar hook assembly protein FlgD